jgi:hypothetical protein
MHSDKQHQECAMFVVEYIVVRGARPIVLESTILTTVELAEAESVAEATILSLRQNRPETGPHIYQIRDESDNVVFRSWEAVI